MEKEIKLKLLNSIGKIYEKSKECKLEDAFFRKIDADLSVLSAYFKTTKSQSFFIAMVFALNYKGDTVDLKDLLEYFDCNPMKLLEYHDDFEHLYSKNIFKKHKSKHRLKLAGANDQFTINEKITEAILQNKPMPVIKQENFEDIFGLLEELYNIVVQREGDEISTRDLFMHTKVIISLNLHFPLIKKVDRFNYDIEDTCLYLYLIWKAISGTKSTYIDYIINLIYDNPSKRVKYMQGIYFGENVLVKNNLIEIANDSFINSSDIKLTDHSHDILNACGIKLSGAKMKKENVLSPNEIPFRTLIFGESEMKQLFLLKDLLDDTKLKETQKRLSGKNLPKGVTALLHGAPGTGKTEIVKQIAKETNRALMKIEISQSKSMWYGESEKIIKRIFTDYKSFAKDCERLPILFFNEADAIISKRRELGNSSVDQTENTVQNIILEELENFDGILIATTNLANNLDTAFERRFLFKIQFHKPNTTVRAKIWKSKLPSLEISDCNLLADKFDFSGGQIDNILRKHEIYEIIHGEKVDLEKLMVFCTEETLGKNRMRIGFKK